MIETLFLRNTNFRSSFSEECAIVTLPDGASQGRLTACTAFPGITVMYNTLNIPEQAARFRSASPMISIDHCQNGRVEWSFPDGIFRYLGEQDVLISTLEHYDAIYGFPVGHYKGITVNIDLLEASRSLLPLQSLFQIDLERIYRRFCDHDTPFFLRADESIQRIFSELYTIQDPLRMSKLRLKVLELLLYLSQIDLSCVQTAHPYFQRSVVERIRRMKNDLCRHPREHVTLSQLSKQYHLSETTIKRCFKVIYGDSLYSFFKTCRLQEGAVLLRTTDKSVLEIALDVGYENPSKFIAAFKKQFGTTPARYRREWQGDH